MTDKTNGDSEELEALFDSIVRANAESTTPEAAPAAAEPQAEVAQPVEAEAKPAAASAPVMEFPIELSEPAQAMFTHIGQLTRKLHDTLRDLGYDAALEKAASAIPDARDRLSYIATLTEQAAEKTLNAIDLAKPLQDHIETESSRLTDQWDKLFSNQLSLEEFKALVQQTRDHLKKSEDYSRQSNERLLEIMMAQDFQDLTGQVIKKVVEMAKEMEGHLLGFLLEHTPQGVKHVDDPNLMNGPVINSEGRTDVVTNQQQVDDLLESLGF